MSSNAKKGGGSKPKHRPLSTNPKIVNPFRETPKGATHLRDRATIKRIQMYKNKAHFTADGKFIGGDLMARTTETPVVRIAPDRRWFGNTRVVGQRDLEKFREQAGQKVKDPFTVVLHYQKLPMTLIDTAPKEGKKTRVDMLQVEPFDETFGRKAIRRKPKTHEFATDYKSFVESAEVAQVMYNTDKVEKDVKNASVERDWMKNPELHPKLRKGTSKRIWNELYKVIDSSDILVQVLDARDPMGTRCKRIEQELKTKERRHKHMIFILNKCDLVPVWVTRAWISYLSEEYPTIAMHSSITNPFGKSALLQVLRQLSQLHSDKKQISVGFVGYPNVGKSSLINTLMGSIVCPAAPIPGETKHWRYITLFKRIYLIDCPGVVPPNHTSPVSNVLKGAVRIEQLDDPVEYIPHLMAQLRPEYIANQYGIPAWTDPIDFLELFCVRSGKLKPGGEPDLKTGARMILQDWLMGRLPHFVPPPHRANDWVQLSGESYKGAEDMQDQLDAEGHLPFAPSRDRANKKRKEMARLKGSEINQQEQDDDDDDELAFDEDDEIEFEEGEMGFDDDDDDDEEGNETLEDDGLNDEIGVDEFETDLGRELKSKLHRLDQADNKRQKLQEGPIVEENLQEDDWKEIHVKPKYARYDQSEEAYLRHLDDKQKEWDNLTEEAKAKYLKERNNYFTTSESGETYLLHPAGGAFSHGGKDEIVLAGPLVELDRAGNTESGDNATDGYVVTVVGGKMVKGGEEVTVTKEDLELNRLFHLQPKTASQVKGKGTKSVIPLPHGKPGSLLKLNAKTTTPSTPAQSAAARSLNNEKKKKMRAKQRELGRW